MMAKPLPENAREALEVIRDFGIEPFVGDDGKLGLNFERLDWSTTETGFSLQSDIRNTIAYEDCAGLKTMRATLVECIGLIDGALKNRP